MRVLVACEFSGIVRDAFIERGHDAVSCDLLPTERPGPHIQGDVRPLLREPWDLVIAHPPCTYLANSGVQYLHKRAGRWQQMIEAAVFFHRCLSANAPRVAVENPTMHRYAHSLLIPKPDCAVHPWWFGENQSKRTCLWLKGLPPLVATEAGDNITAPLSWHDKWAFAKGDERRHARSITYPGIAKAMAEQWG